MSGSVEDYHQSNDLPINVSEKEYYGVGRKDEHIHKKGIDEGNFHFSSLGKMFLSWCTFNSSSHFHHILLTEEHVVAVQKTCFV